MECRIFERQPVPFGVVGFVRQPEIRTEVDEHLALFIGFDGKLFGKTVRKCGENHVACFDDAIHVA